MGGKLFVMVVRVLQRLVSNKFHGLYRTLCIIVGGGPLGHPKIFINLVRPSAFVLQSWVLIYMQDKPGPQPCGYVVIA